jgi:hypothetical protein
MNEIERLCDLCASQGASALLGRLQGFEDLEALAQAFAARAELLHRTGDEAGSSQLREAVRSLAQYAAYRDLPYDLD